MSQTINWDALIAEAKAARAGAYSPYSSFPVGAAARVDDGRIVTGCNVENASYGLTLCAECGLVSALHSTGGGKLQAVVCVDKDDRLIAPCGRCRQLLSEHSAPGMQIKIDEGIFTIEELLPHSFGPQNL